MEKTFDKLVDLEELTFTDIDGGYFRGLDTESVLELLQKVREATITEAVEFCVSQDWIKTIDNLKRLPKDRIYEFENK